MAPTTTSKSWEEEDNKDGSSSFFFPAATSTMRTDDCQQPPSTPWDVETALENSSDSKASSTCACPEEEFSSSGGSHSYYHIKDDERKPPAAKKKQTFQEQHQKGSILQNGQEEYMESSSTTLQLDVAEGDNDEDAVREVVTGNIDALRLESLRVEQEQQKQRQNPVDTPAALIDLASHPFPTTNMGNDNKAGDTTSLVKGRISTFSRRRDGNAASSSTSTKKTGAEKGSSSKTRDDDESMVRDILETVPPPPTISRHATVNRRARREVLPGAVAVSGRAVSSRRTLRSSQATAEDFSDDSHRDPSSEFLQAQPQHAVEVVHDDDLEQEFLQRIMESEAVEAVKVVPLGGSKEFCLEQEEKEEELRQKILKEREQQRKRMLLWGSLFLLFVIVGVVVGIMLSGGGGGASGEALTKEATPSPTLAPTLTERDYLVQLVLELDQESEGAMDDPTTPQFQALNWLLEPDQLEAWNIYDPANQKELQQRYALAVLYYATGGPMDWLDSLGFLGRASVCDWTKNGKGITCNSQSQVTDISLESHQLNGTLPSELASLTTTKQLLVSSNLGLTGTLPSEFAKLSSSLFLLDASECDLVGTVPSSYSQLTILETLYLFNNKLTGSLPQRIFIMGNLGGLKYVDLSQNQFSGTIPEFNTQFAYREVRLNHNQFHGPLPVALFSNRQLQVVDLSHNQLTGTIGQQTVAATKLKELYLGHNKFTGRIPTQLGRLFDLTQLRLDQNQLVGRIPSQLGFLRECEALDLSFNLLTGTIPEELGKIDALLSLSLQSNPSLSGTVPASLATKSVPLVELQIQDTSLTGGLEQTFCALEIMPNITADCGGSAPEISCSCCSTCCGDTNGEDCTLQNVGGN